MANTLQARFTARIVDELTTEASFTSYAVVDPTAAVSTIITTFYSWLTALDNVTAGRIVSAEVCVYPSLPALKGVPASGSRNEQTAVLSFTAPPTTRRDSMAVPALASSLIASNQVIVASGAVQTFINFIVGGGSSMAFATSAFETPVTFKDALLTFREYDNQIEPNTFVLG
jgi:hypothetical protein